MEDILEELMNNNIVVKTFWTLVIILSATLIYKILAIVLFQKFEKRDSKNGNRFAIYILIFKSIIKYAIVIITFLLILQLFGINISSIVAGVGVLGVVFSFAIQDWLKDFIRGGSIISDNYFSVGDIVKYKTYEGKVIKMGLRTTKIQDIKTKNIISIANRNIDEIQILSNVIYVKIPLSYDVKVNKAEKVVNDIIERVKKLESVDDCIYKGVSELADSSIKYLIQVTCNPFYKLQVERDTNREILLGLEANKLEVPYNQIDVHQK